MNAPLRHAISMRELQKMSAKQIQDLRHAVPITSAGRTVAMLSPLRTASPADLERLAQTRQRFDESLTDDEKQRIAKLLEEIEPS
jgi:antitoxin (DNA-binding transcriptional repressor) of toxin-antitoxin stability system